MALGSWLHSSLEFEWTSQVIMRTSLLRGSFTRQSVFMAEDLSASSSLSQTQPLGTHLIFFSYPSIKRKGACETGCLGLLVTFFSETLFGLSRGGMSPCQPFPGLHCWSVWIKPSSSIQGQPPAAATCPLCPLPPPAPGLSPSMQEEKGLYCPSLFSEAEDDPGAQRSLINFMTDSPTLCLAHFWLPLGTTP